MCQVWSLTQRKEQRLKVFENKLPRRRYETTRGIEKLHNKDLHDLTFHLVLGEIKLRGSR
jgi:hypothetical protein